MKKLGAVMVSVLAVASMQGGRADGAVITYNGSLGSLAASVTFQDNGTDLIVTLTNTSIADVLVPTDVLTAVFFDSLDTSLTTTSAVLNAGSSVLFGGTDPGNVVGGEWAYNSGSLAGLTQNAGISSSGLGIFGPPDRFPGTNLQGPASPNGLQYGITSAGDNAATGNTPVTGTNALILNSVVFTLGGWSLGDVSSAKIFNVRFQYGTDVSEPSITTGGVSTSALVVAEPASLSLVGVTMMAMGAARRSRRRRQRCL